MQGLRKPGVGRAKQVTPVLTRCTRDPIWRSDAGVARAGMPTARLKGAAARMVVLARRVCIVEGFAVFAGWAATERQVCEFRGNNRKAQSVLEAALTEINRGAPGSDTSENCQVNGLLCTPMVARSYQLLADRHL